MSGLYVWTIIIVAVAGFGLWLAGRFRGSHVAQAKEKAKVMRQEATTLREQADDIRAAAETGDDDLAQKLIGDAIKARQKEGDGG